MGPIVNMLVEDRATAIGNMHNKIGKVCAWGSGDILKDRQTHKHTDTLITVLRNRSRGRSKDIIRRDKEGIDLVGSDCRPSQLLLSSLFYFRRGSVLKQNTFKVLKRFLC